MTIASKALDEALTSLIIFSPSIEMASEIDGISNLQGLRVCYHRLNVQTLCILLQPRNRPDRMIILLVLVDYAASILATYNQIMHIFICLTDITFLKTVMLRLLRMSTMSP